MPILRRKEANLNQIANSELESAGPRFGQKISASFAEQMKKKWKRNLFGIKIGFHLGASDLEVLNDSCSIAILLGWSFAESPSSDSLVILLDDDPTCDPIRWRCYSFMTSLVMLFAFDAIRLWSITTAIRRWSHLLVMLLACDLIRRWFYLWIIRCYSPVIILLIPYVCSHPSAPSR